VYLYTECIEDSFITRYQDLDQDLDPKKKITLVPIRMYGRLWGLIPRSTVLRAIRWPNSDSLGKDVRRCTMEISDVPLIVGCWPLIADEQG